MLLVKKSDELQTILNEKRKKGYSIGFVPTMGALHAGHTSLIASSGKENTLTIASIFVNPSQFNDPDDLKKYPLTIEMDIYNLEASFCDILFYPGTEEMYPAGFNKPLQYDLGFLETVLEGKYRPGHFQGVCQAMHRLLNIIKPDNLYLGQKDYQQCMVIKRLIELIGLNNKVSVKVCPTIREPDGLAMSSRNIRLGPEERKKATGIAQVLNHLKNYLKPGSTKEILNEAGKMLEKDDFRTDYIEIADRSTFEHVKNWDGKQKVIGLAAAYMNDVRLIDNLFLN